AVCALAALAAEEGRPRLMVAWLVPALLAKEDVALVVAGFGVMLALTAGDPAGGRGGPGGGTGWGRPRGRGGAGEGRVRGRQRMAAPLGLVGRGRGARLVRGGHVRARAAGPRGAEP